MALETTNIKQTTVKNKFPPLNPHLVVILLYLLVALVFTAPLLLNFNSATPGADFNDRNQNLWFMWWVKQALLDYHVTPLYTNYMFYPGGINLYLFPLNLTGAIISLPIQAVFGLVPAFNLLYYFGLVGGAWGGFCLTRHLTGHSIAAFVAGLVYAFAPWQKPASENNQLNIIQLQWLPFFLLWLLKFLDSLESPPVWKFRLRYGTLSAIFLVLIAFTDQYHLLFAASAAAFLVGWRVIRLLLAQHWRKAVSMAVFCLLLPVPAFLAYLPILIGLSKDSGSGFFDETVNAVRNTDLLTLFVPWRPMSGVQGLVSDNSVFPVGWWLILLLGGLALGKWRKSRVWVGLLLLLVIISLDDSLVVAGKHTGIPLPGALLGKLPLVHVMHFGWRWLIPASLALGICCAYGLIWLEEKLKYRVARPAWLVSGVAAVLLLVAVQPYPIPQDLWKVNPVPAIYTKGLLTRPGAILEMPLNEKIPDNARKMYYQTLHGRPIAFGYVSRTPIMFDDRQTAQNYTSKTPFYDYGASPFTFFYEDKTLSDEEQDALKPETSEIRSFLAYYNVAYLVLYKQGLEERSIARLKAKMVRAVAAEKQGCLYEDAEVLLCEVDYPATLQPYLGYSRGWYAAEQDAGGQRWIVGQEAFLSAFAPRPTEYKLVFNAAAYLKPRPLQIEVDGKILSTLQITPARTPYTVLLNLSEGTHLIRLYSADAPDTPSANGTPADTRTLTLLFSGMDLTP